MSVENRSADPLASRTGCNLHVPWLFLPNFHSSRNGNTVTDRTRRNTQCSMCLTLNEAQRLGATRMRARGHGDRTVSRGTDAARHVSTARHAADRTGTNKGACPLAERGEATHPGRYYDHMQINNIKKTEKEAYSYCK
ncbi:MAG: hypothetical protein LBT76_03065, partial [Tannerella sp.]|nr:hypothetical protein [Tannerella sp.]